MQLGLERAPSGARSKVTIALSSPATEYPSTRRADRHGAGVLQPLGRVAGSAAGGTADVLDELGLERTPLASLSKLTIALSAIEGM